MIPVRATVIIDDDVFDALAVTMDAAPKRLRNGAQRIVSREGSKVLKELQAAPEPSPLPFVWSLNPAKQERARRWYFANKVPKGRGRGKGRGRYRRTGTLKKAWKVRANLSDRNGLLVLENDAPGAAFVYGPRQVPSHMATGWPEGEKVAFAASERLTDALIDYWFEASIPKGYR